MGEVWKAKDAKLGREVAIKTLPEEVAGNPDRLSRFQREARMLAALNHPNIAAIYGLEEFDGHSFLVLELVEGETLTERLKRTGPFTVDESLGIAMQVAEALETAHIKGITHRDIKPANIKVTPAGRVKVLDFGLAKNFVTVPEILDSNMETQVTETGVILGTPAYMSPEQVRGQQIDHRTDIWAFGCVLYELLTGTRAFRGENQPDLLAAVMTGQPDWRLLPSATPERVRGLLRRTLEKDLSQRLDAIADARAEIELVKAGRHGISRRTIVAVSGLGIAAVLGLPVATNIGGLRDRLTGSVISPRIRSIAVLPLANLSGNADQEYFSDGLTESLITDLAKISALKVISRSSVMTFKDTRKPLHEIANELNVDALLPGSVQRAGNRIRIGVQLIDGKTDRILWAESYDRDLADVLVLQSEIARTVAQQIKAQLTPQEQTRLTSARPVNAAAYEAVLQGRVHAAIQTRHELDTALQYFELARQKDPNYAPAYAGIARVWGTRRAMWYAGEEADQEAIAAIQKALVLDNSSVEVLGQLAGIQGSGQWNWREAETTYRRALQIEPNRAGVHSVYAMLLWTLQRPVEAVEHAERAIELDPLNPLLLAVYAEILSFVGRYDEAIDQARRTLAAQPNQNIAHEALSLAFLGKGMLKETVEAFIGASKRDEDFEKASVLQRGYDEGRYEAAVLSTAELLEKRWRSRRRAEGALRSTDFVTTAGEIAFLYHAAGLPEKTLEWWEKAVDDHDPSVSVIRATLPQGNIREDNPRFQALLRRVGIP
jgi:non-specific serine/threonine protein kinase